MKSLIKTRNPVACNRLIVNYLIKLYIDEPFGQAGVKIKTVLTDFDIGFMSLGIHFNYLGWNINYLGTYFN